ncbi:MAG: FHA domain-containing protein [Anaerolineae bacterium]|nr:FHA domain-containing protein [Anaerolineae bacterium]
MEPVQTCKNCGKPNPADAAYCFACGHILPTGVQSLQTHALSGDESLTPQLRWGTAYFGVHSILRIRVRHSDELIEHQFTKVVVLGRAVGDEQPDIDLTPYGAVDLGVSRQHVKLTRELATVMIEDLGSSNGTFLNGQKLIPYQPRVLRNEDELRLGRMVLRISFLKAPRPRPTTPDSTAT